MKIAFVSQPFDTVRPPHHNSIGLWIYEVARRLVKHHPITVYTRGRRFSPTCDEVDGLVFYGTATAPDMLLLKLLKRLTWLWPNRQRPQFASWLYYFGYSLQVALDCRRKKVDLVHILNFTQFVPVIRFFNPTVKLILHMQAEWLSQLDYAFIDKRLQQTDLILGSSDHITHLVQQRFPHHQHRCQTIYNGVDITQFTRQRKQAIGENREPKQHRLLFVGRVSPEKGVHLILDAFRQVVAQRSNVHLTIVGSHGQLPLNYIIGLSDQPELQQLARFYQRDDRYAYIAYLKQQVAHHNLADKVTFTGPVSHDDVVAYFQQADLLLNPSLSESFGIGVIEAMMCQVPVIATPVGGLKETIVPEETGLLVEIDNAPALAEAIERLLDNDPLRQQMGWAGRKRAESLFAWKSIAARLTGLYHPLLEPECQPE